MLARTQARLVVVELGAGKAIPTVRMRAERIAATAAAGGSLIRVNPDPAAGRRAGGPHRDRRAATLVGPFRV
jgi:hypothetical protein